MYIYIYIYMRPIFIMALLQNRNFPNIKVSKKEFGKSGKIVGHQYPNK